MKSCGPAALTACAGRNDADSDAAAGADWHHHAGGIDESRFRRPDDMNAGTADRLGPFQHGRDAAMEAAAEAARF